MLDATTSLGAAALVLAAAVFCRRAPPRPHPPGKRLGLTCPCLTVHRDDIGLLAHWVAVQTQMMCLQLRFWRLSDNGRLSTWPLVQWELRRVMKLEGWKRMDDFTRTRPGTFTARRLFSRLAPKAQVQGMSSAPIVKDLVLVGGGHSHVHVLKMFGMKPEPGVQLTLVTRDVETPYSGMLPGYVAGLYTRQECHIDLAKLCTFAGARMVHAEAIGLDTDAKRVVLKGRPSLPYDVVSIDIGSAPKPIAAIHESTRRDDASVTAITPVKPIDGFCARWDSILERVLALADGQRARIVVVGGGAGGVELALSMQARLLRELERAQRSTTGVEVSLVTRSRRLMPQHASGTRDIFERILSQRGVALRLGCAVVEATHDELVCDDGTRVPFDEAVWCTQGGAQEWLGSTGLELDEGGFIAVHPTLESTSTPAVFAAGDVAAVLEHPRPKAGVFAVRQGPPLAANLRAKLLGKPLVPFAPQRRFLGLIGAGDGNCVASSGPMALEGRWLWELKDWIDRFWMAQYSSALPDMGGEDAAPPAVAAAAGSDALEALSHTSMRCGGCGAKVGATVLSRVMARLKAGGYLEGEQRGVLLGLDAPDDCAVLEPSKLASVHTVDFFRSFVSDPFVFGQVAANHALSDCHAMGAKPSGALAIAVVPYGLEDKVEDSLYQMMCGACDMLQRAGCALLGGHTCEGAELSLGFCVTGHVAPAVALRKGGMRAGQAIVLTKPLGTGVLFAASMRRAAAGAWVAEALRAMTTSNEAAAQCLLAHGATSCTDVTGFGMLGHLLEMAKASDALVTVELGAVPLLPGAAECVRKGIFSSLQPANVRLKRAVSNEAEALQHETYPLLFDPQTAGGLLASVPPERVDACVAELRRLGYPHAAVVGEVSEIIDPEETCAATLIHCRA